MLMYIFIKIKIHENKIENMCDLPDDKMRQICQYRYINKRQEIEVQKKIKVPKKPKALKNFKLRKNFNNQRPCKKYSR